MNLVKVTLGQAEFPQQKLHQFFRAVIGYFQAHTVTKATAEQLAAQGRRQVFQVIFQLKVSVTGQTELVTAFDFHAREQLIRVGVDHRRQEHQVLTTFADFIRQAHQTRQRPGRRQDGHAGFPAKGVFAIQFHDKVQALVHQARERM